MDYTEKLRIGNASDVTMLYLRIRVNKAAKDVENSDNTVHMRPRSAKGAQYTSDIAALN